MLGAGQLCALELNPVEFVRAAAAARLDAVSLFVCQPGPQATFQLTTPDNLGAVRAALNDHAMQVANIDCLMLTPQTRVEAFRPHLELGAELGARGVTVLLYDPDESRVAEGLLVLCEMGRTCGLRINIEFMPLAPGWKTLTGVATLIRQMARPNLGITIDLLHLVRSGGSAAEIAATDPGLISCAQLCDSLDTQPGDQYFEEASLRRLAPGDGAFPIADMLRALPDPLYLELEVPQPSTIAAADRLSDIAEAARRAICQARANA